MLRIKFCMTFIPAFLLVVLAQDARSESDIGVGARVRLKIPKYYKALVGTPWLKGHVVALRTDTLVVVSEVYRRLVVPAEQVAVLEVQSGEAWKEVSLSSAMVIIVASEEMVKRDLMEPGRLSINPGDRIRLSLRADHGGVFQASRRITGICVLINQDTLEVDKQKFRNDGVLIGKERNLEKISLSTITRFEKQAMNPRYGYSKGAKVGAIIGFSVGLLGGLASGGTDSQDEIWGCIGPCFSATEVGLILGAGLGVVGAIIGVMTGHDMWDEVEVVGPIGIAPLLPKGVPFGLRCDFRVPL